MFQLWPSRSGWWRGAWVGLKIHNVALRPAGQQSPIICARRRIRELKEAFFKVAETKMTPERPDLGHKKDTTILSATHLFQYSLHNWLLWSSGLKRASSLFFPS